MIKYFKHSYLFGLVGAALCLLAFWVFHWVDLDPVDFTLFFACMITPIFVFVGIKNFRDTQNGQELVFAQGMTVGFVIYGLIAVLASLGVWSFLHMDSSIFMEYRTTKLEWLKNQESYISENVSPKAFEDTWAESEKMSIGDIALDIFLKIFMLELFFTIIISIILKRTKK
ncbi:DUF4199 domain-containing protein [Echinicola jeungdonensis]|uniref:DUF4199 domain-containing protein n=1 Tax=Echinicola jeungdonensis TaxID=709343 RepID=A0ABV5J3F0_9BACT|nr:DUF4199 domain-containing protein [Echinicola jeungdonensis]MDN3668172.1 DUF4199 domain-containing protein [Echinicola jeungdonensis]